ncbi:MAG: hypothetical protein AB1656_16740 [Candidatus Omnitrophota bacterium]
MVATEKLIHRIRALPPEQAQQVSNFIDGLDNEIGLDENIAEHDRRLQDTHEEDFILHTLVCEKILRK